MNLRTRILIGLGALVLGVPLATWTFGSFLPVSHVASVEVRLGAPPELVWARIADPLSSAAWRDSIRSVERLADRDGKPCFREETEYGPMTYVHSERQEAERLVTCIVDDANFGGCWEYVLESDGTGTRLVITERGDVYSPIFRVIGKYFIGYETTLKVYASDLQASLGEG